MALSPVSSRPSIVGPVAFPVANFSAHHKPSPDLFDGEGARRERAQQLGFQAGEIEPGEPIGPLENDHLAIMDRRHVGPGLR